MNIIVLVLLVFSLIGFLDKIFHMNLGFAESFDQGMKSMGTLSISLVGLLTVGVTFVENHIDFFSKILSYFPSQPSILIGMFLAPDMGGYSLSSTLSTDTSMIILGGIIVSSLLGQTISFQFPVFLSSIHTYDVPLFMKGVVIGMISIPFSVFISGLLLGISFLQMMIQIIPVFIFCIGITILLFVYRDKMIKILNVFASGIQYLTYLLFIIVVIGIVIPDYAYCDIDSVKNAMISVLNITLVVCGSMVLCEVIMKYFQSFIIRLSSYFSMNTYGVIGLILCFASSLAILPIFNKMDEKGKLLNSAFSVSGAYVLGGQLGFISLYVSLPVVLIYIFSKILCGFISVIIMNYLYSHSKI